MQGHWGSWQLRWKLDFITHMWRDEEEYVQMFVDSIQISWLRKRKIQEKENPLYAKRDLKLKKNKIFIITILKAQGNFTYIHEQATSKHMSKQHIGGWQRDWTE